MIFLVVKGVLLSKLVLVFMNLLKVNLVHEARQGTLMQNLKCSTRRWEVNPINNQGNKFFKENILLLTMEVIVSYFLKWIMLNVMYVIILDMLQPDAEVKWFKTVTLKDHHIPDTLRDIALLAICLVTKPLTAIEWIWNIWDAMHVTSLDI